MLWLWSPDGAMRKKHLVVHFIQSIGRPADMIEVTGLGRVGGAGRHECRPDCRPEGGNAPGRTCD